jgi:hypothetical protein
MTRRTITSGKAPLVWSTIDEAFENINANFNDLYASIGDTGSISFDSLGSNIVPSRNNAYDLGTASKRWNNLFLSGTLSLGGVQITSEGLTIDLPSGTTVGGELIINPEKPFFKEVSVNGNTSVVANSFNDSINLEEGTAIRLVVNSSSDTIIITNTGVTSLVGSAGLGVSASTGAITLSNTGVRSLTTSNGLSVNTAATGSVSITNTGVIRLEAGPSISLSNGGLPDVDGKVIITNTAPAGNAYRTIAVNGEATLTAPSTAATLTFIKGSGINIATALASGALTNRITIENTGVLSLTAGAGITLSASTGAITIGFDKTTDMNASIFADNSTLLVDAVSGLIPAAVVQGTFTGYHVGDHTGSVFADDSTKLIDAVEGKIVGPVFANVTGNTTGTHTGIVITSLIASSDSSAIQVTSPVTFQGDIRAENDLILGSIGGGRIIGDFSNSIFESRVHFQTSTLNTFTSVGATPNGSATFSDFRAYSSRDTNNSAYGSFHADATGHVGVNSGKTGTGVTQPLTLQIDSNTVISVTAGGFTNAGVQGTAAVAPTIASATTIAPTKDITFISGTAAIATITAPSPISAGGGQITLIPTGIFTTTTGGNIALATTAVVNRALIMTYDSGTAKWYPSY